MKQSPIPLGGGLGGPPPIGDRVKSLDLGVDFVLPLSQEGEEEEPSPKFTREEHSKTQEIAQLGFIGVNAKH